MSEIEQRNTDQEIVQKGEIETNGNSLYLQFIKDKIFPYIESEQMYLDLESGEQYADLHSATVLYSTVNDITTNIYTRVHTKPLLEVGSIFESMVGGGSVGTAKQYMIDLAAEDSNAIKGYTLEIDFFKGKYMPGDNAGDVGYKDYFGISPEEVESDEWLGHFEADTWANGFTELQVHLEGRNNASMHGDAGNIKLMTDWLSDAAILEHESIAKLLGR